MGSWVIWVGMLRTSQPNHTIRRCPLQDFPGVRLGLHIIQTGQEHVEFALFTLCQGADVVLVLGVANDRGDVPGAVEEERREVHGHFAMAAEEEDLHIVSWYLLVEQGIWYAVQLAAGYSTLLRLL